MIGVARFSDASQEAALQAHGIETVRADLLDEAALDRLPDAPNVIFMAGRKFGSTGGESLTWAMNVHLPALVCRRYSTSRIVAFSTGNVVRPDADARGGRRPSKPMRPAPSANTR